MTAFNTLPTDRISVPGTGYPTQAWESGTARFAAHWGRSGAVVTVHGEIDAANAAEFTDHLGRFLSGGEWLVLDLTDLQFIGTAGFAALASMHARCTQHRMAWSLVPGPAACRMLRICDPHGRLPLAESLTVALTALQDSQRLLHLVAQPGQ